MSQYLLLIALGPVQDFIAQARRTRDLWYGSHLLSELSRTAARALADGGAKLVVPALSFGDAELQPCAGPLRPDGQPPINVANKLLAEVPEGTDPSELARSVRAAVAAFWREGPAARVRKQCEPLLVDGVDDVWTEQIDSFIEFIATWTPVDDYADARRAVERQVAARKNLRDFEPWLHARGNVAKSSLDGARETVLCGYQQRDAKLVRDYRIAVGEELDAVGLVKRAGGDPGQFVPVVNVALASWVSMAADQVPERLAELRTACRTVGLAGVHRDLPCADAFPFDASVLLRSRWQSVFKEQGIEGDPVAWGHRHVDPVLDGLAEPYPYVACLRADGDRMGRVIERLATSSAHRAFAKHLAAFAAEARRIVEQEHLGSLVYSGGDDVLAFLPIPQALACAAHLRERFIQVMRLACSGLDVAEQPTLSVGIGVGHVMESMGDLLMLGREAEDQAKQGHGDGGGRNSLAVVVDKRSGGRRSWVGRWDDSSGDPVVRLRSAARSLLEDQLSTRKVYEISRTLALLPPPSAVESGWSRVLAFDVRRSLSRVCAGQGGVMPEEIGLVLDERTPYPDLHASVSAWVERMLVARTLSNAEPRLRRQATEAVML